MKEICFMKKLFILILVLISALALVSCGSTKEIQTIDDEAVATADSNQQVVTEADGQTGEPAEVVEESQQEPEIPEEPTEVTEEEPAAEEQLEEVEIEEPVVVDQQDAQEVAEVVQDTEVISTPAALSAEEIKTQFSYVYGHLLGSGIVAEGILIHPAFYALGSEDFMNYADLRISVEEINQASTDYQKFLDGEITEEDLVANSSEDPSVPGSLIEKFSYGYGYLVMYNIQMQGIQLDLASYVSGIEDASSGVPLPYSEAEIDQVFAAYEEQMIADYYAAMDAVADDNLAQAEAYLSENALEEGVVTTESGLQYKVISTGEGAKPTAEDTVKLDYTLTFLDGSIGDSSYDRGEPSTFEVANLIPGFIEGLTLMNVGSRYQFYVHPSLGYGELGNDTVAPNSLLIFDVELHEIVTE
jgi:FKBP-type peptidyl-prolyl cis-trans isomerase